MREMQNDSDSAIHHLHHGPWPEHCQLVLEVTDFCLEAISLLENLLQFREVKSRPVGITFGVYQFAWKTIKH